MSGNLYNQWNLWISTMEKRKNWISTVLNSNCARNISVEMWCFGKDNVIKDFYKKKKKKRLQNWDGNSWITQLAFIFVFGLHIEKYLCGVWEFKWYEFLSTLYLHRDYCLIYVANLIRIAYILNFLNKIISQVRPLYSSSFVLSTYIYHQSFIGKFCINKYLPIETLILTVPIWVQRMD